MRKIIVLQLARYGDILQTLPTIQGLKKKEPSSHVTLVTRSTFGDAAKLSPYVDTLLEFPSEQILGPVVADAADKAESLARLIRWVADALRGDQYDLLLNLTFSPASAYMAGLVRAREKRGVLTSSTSNGGPFEIPDPWSQYFFAQVVNHNLNIIHVNDLFARIAGAEVGAWPLELREPEDCQAAPARIAGKARIGIQLTASSPEKTLSVDSWATVCRTLLADASAPELVFFGSSRDLSAVRSVIAKLDELAPGLSDGRCHIAAGRLKFNENLPWVRSCDWIVAPDTAIVHLASACGPRVIQISIGGVRPDDTGPYGDGHFIIYPRNADAAQLALEVNRIVASGGEEKAGTTVAQATTRLAPTTLGAPRNEIVPHNFIQDEVSGFFMQAYYLLAEFRCGGRQEDITIPRIGNPGQAAGLDRLVAAYDALCTARRLAEFGQHYCMKMLEVPNDVPLLKELMAKLAEIETMIAKLESSVSLIKPLTDSWRVAKDIACWPSADAGIEETLALTEGCYRELGQNVDIVQQLLQTAVEAAQGRLKPKTERSETDVAKEKVES